jgi:hypothetical protein
MALSDVEIRKAKPKAAPYKKFDEGGLFLLINPSGSKLWRLKYRFDGKEKLLALGSYPEKTLLQARNERKEALDILEVGRDPGAERKAAKQKKALKAQNAFKVIALDFVERMGKRWGEKHRANAISRLEANIFPYLGSRQPSFHRRQCRVERTAKLPL